MKGVPESSGAGRNRPGGSPRRRRGVDVLKNKKHSALYRHIERLHGERPWGALLDAGTGVNSLQWIVGLETERWTAVSGSEGEADRARKAVEGAQRAQDRMVTGNWADPALLDGEVYDTVLADYLLGAIEGFAPYFQAYLFARLRPITRRALYVTGIEPYVPAARPDDEAARIIWEIGRFRDACVLLAGARPYREYPARWAADQLQRAGFAVHEVKHYGIRYKELFVNAQIDMRAPGLEKMADRDLARALKAHGEALRAEALDMIRKEGGLRSCRNYVIAAEPV